ncbi:hypothetical protein [Actinomadura rupiterrae]|uniref:hypothetical protein n=1 Tax=Actinomadura rupiterrae TaxID=559627 RepID=UPI0020A39E65|nr:hypothetical protein [Actinomadura rupiterrae]MCP2334690.1 putative peptide zinc metalloprotease protein [Actinomadura rupiterrae]
MNTPASPSEHAVAGRRVLPTLAEGAELLGEYRNSGYREPPRLVRLPNRQLVRLAPLLYLVAEALRDLPPPPASPPPSASPPSSADAVSTGDASPAVGTAIARDGEVAAALDEAAATVSRRAGVRITGEQVAYIADTKLAPLGITSYSDGRPPPLVKADPFLGLRFRMTLLPERGTWLLAGMFAWLFHPVVLVLAMGAVASSEIWLLGSHSPAEALRQVIMRPVTILLVLALSVFSCLFHEAGHAAACRYGGERPGVMGCGIYLVWPAFFTDITESYRLGRGARLRTDLGGVYFNGLYIVALTLAYLQTGFAPLLVVALYVNMEIVQQLLPTLRFDGYYIMSDLVGIPDLFKYIGPILSRTVLRRPADVRLDVLKRWPQLIVTAWVVTIVPVLVLQLGILFLSVPGLVVDLWRMTRTLAANATAGPLETVVSVLQILLLALPVLGLALLAAQLVRWLARKIVALAVSRPRRPADQAA